MENFDINRFFKVLFNCKLYICFVLILFIVMGYFYSFYYVTPLYNSSATVVLVQNDNLGTENNDFSITQSDITLNQNLLSTYTKIAKSTKVLEQVINNLNLDISVNDLSNNISVHAVNNAEVFKISVVNRDKNLAASITNELLDVFSNEVKSLYNMNNVYTIDIAKVSDSPYNVNHVKDIAIFAVIGIFVSFGIVVIVYLLDTTIKSEHEVENYTKLTVLSTIPKYFDKQNKSFNELIVNVEPKSPIAECFKTFRTNIMFSIQNKKLNTILVTSGSMGEGKSFVSSNLAVSFAKSGKSVILVDTDMRKGRVHKIFNLMNNAGLSNVLSNIGINGSSVNINNYIQKSGVPNLHIMTSGDIPPNPSELLSSINMKRFLEALNTQYDVVICDGTPCTLVADSIILSKIVDTTVIVTAARSTKLDTLNKIKKSIKIVGGHIGGVVINKMPVSAKSYQNKYYYGNHNDTTINFGLDLYDDNDNILDGMLCISDDILLDTEIEELADNKVEDVSLQATYNTDYKNDNFDKLSNILIDNSKDIAELKGLYKNVVQDSLDVVYKTNSANSIMKQIEDIKEVYQNNIDIQNEYISVIDTKISNFKLEDNANANAILDELTSIKASYEDAIDYQNDYIAELDNKISNLNVEDNTNSILDELTNIKTSYEIAISSQTEYIDEYISDLNNKISNLNVKDNFNSILNELNSIKTSYEDSITSQNEYISGKVTDNSNAVLDELYKFKTTYEDGVVSQNEYIARKVRNNSNAILDELNSMKASYENAISSQTEYINNKFGNNSNNILDKLNNIKASYEDSIVYQNAYIDDKLENNSNNILTELSNIKASYENAINHQAMCVKELDNKISNLGVDDDFNIVLDELNTIKASYENAILLQTEYIAELDSKISNFREELDNTISNFKLEDNFTSLLNELNTIKASYEDAISSQNNEITGLKDGISNINNNDVLSAVSNIYKQLETINSKFDSLEKKSKDNENLIKKIAKANIERNIQVTDIRKLDDKVVRMKDYLANGYDLNKANSSPKKIKDVVNAEPTITEVTDTLVEEVPSVKTNKANTTKKTKDIKTEKVTKKEKAVSKVEENVNDVNEVEKTNKVMKKDTSTTDVIKENKVISTDKSAKSNEKKSSVVDYSVAKSKMKKGFFNFNSRYAEEDDEDVNIVSQILCKNKEESVG